MVNGVCIILISEKNLYVYIIQGSLKKNKLCHLTGSVYLESSVMGNVEYLVSLG